MMRSSIRPEAMHAHEARSYDESLRDLHRSFRRSTYILSAGGTSNFYADFDAYFLGNVGDHSFDLTAGLVRLEELRSKVAPEILKTAARHGATRLAFFEKRDDGPVGILAAADLILDATGLEGCIVRPHKRLVVARVKGRPIEHGERVMIVGDVATTGTTLAQPARCLREFGAIVSAAFVLLDRGQEARNRLAREGISLTSYWSVGDIADSAQRRSRPSDA